jgi:DNA-binding response OmpR family regulator
MSIGTADLKDRRILIVEDEYFIAEDIAHALRQGGARVVGPTGDPDEAMRLLSGERIDVAVLDVNLHGEMVYPIAAELRSRGVPFMFATGYDQTHIPADYADVPRAAKPLNWRMLVQSISALAQT